MHRRLTSSPRRGAALVLAVALVALLAPAALAKAPKPKPGAKADEANGVSFTLSLWLGPGAQYKVRNIRDNCTEHIQGLDETSKEAKEDHTLGYDPTNGVFDGCIASASWVEYQVDVTAPWKGQIQFQYGNGQAGGSYSIRCLRWWDEKGLWCHKTGQNSAVIGKLN